jgi:Uncharacterized conserved protein (DUF2285)
MVPPASADVTAYDEAHLVDYLQILDAAAAGADWHDVAQTVLGLDPVTDPVGARAIYDRHFDRARWMTEVGYKQLAARGRGNKKS